MLIRPTSGRLTKAKFGLIMILLAVLCTPAFGITAGDSCISQCMDRYDNFEQAHDCLCKVCGEKQFCPQPPPEEEPIPEATDCIPKNVSDLDTIACTLECTANYADEAKKTDCWCTECGIPQCCSPGKTAKKNHPPVLRVSVEPEKPFVGGPTVYDQRGDECLAVITAIGSDEEDGSNLEYKFTSSRTITGVGGGWNTANSLCIPPNEPEGMDYVIVLARDSKGALSNEVTVFVTIHEPEDIEDLENYSPIRIEGQPTENKGAGPVEWGGHEYEAAYTPIGISWDDAKAAAEAKGGHLVSITSEAENQFVYSLVEDDKFWYWDGYDGNGPWLGGYQEQGSFEPDGGWAWSGPGSFEYTNWGRGEPNNGGIKTSGVEDNLELIGKGTLKGNEWNDKPGSTKEKGYIIEWETK